MEENINKSNNPNQTGKNPGKKTYYKKRYNPQPRKRKFWNADKVVSLSAMAIALFTLAVLLYQSYILDRQYELTVKQQKASVLPYLQLASGFSDDSYRVILQNKGLGPAFINGLYAKEKDSTFILFSLYDYYLQHDNPRMYNYQVTGIIPGSVLAPGEVIELFTVEASIDSIKPVKIFFSEYFSGMGSDEFLVEYESVFEDAWMVTSSYQNVTKEEYGEFEIFYDLVE